MNVFDLENCNFFRYLQVGDFLNRVTKQLEVSESKLINFLRHLRPKVAKKIILQLYKECYIL